MPVFTTSEDAAGQRLDHFLSRVMPEFSRARLQSWVDDGKVSVNGSVAAKASMKLRAGDVVSVTPAPVPPLRAEPEAIPLRILYEDENVIAIDKPAGLVVHAGAGQSSGTLVNALLHRFASLSRLGGELRPGIVHRLDKGTSGVLLVAKTDAAHQQLARQFQQRTIEKVYLAMVEGSPSEEQGSIDKPITRDPVRRTRMTARLGAGRSAHTTWRVLERLPGYTLLEVRIGTGRTHQIRVHLASLGHPVAGDTLYGARRQSSLSRPWLHALRIAFTAPVSGERLSIEAPLPEELEAWKKCLLQ